MKHILVLDTDKPEIIREAAAIPVRLYARLDYERMIEDGKVVEPSTALDIGPCDVEVVKVDTWKTATPRIPHALFVEGSGYKRTPGKPTSLNDLLIADHPLDKKDPPRYLVADSRVLMITRWNESRSLGDEHALVRFQAYVYLPENRFSSFRLRMGAYTNIEEASYA